MISYYLKGRSLFFCGILYQELVANSDAQILTEEESGKGFQAFVPSDFARGMVEDLCFDHHLERH